MKIRDVIKLLEHDQWRLVRMRGSHWQFHHVSKPGAVTIAGHPRADVQTQTLNSVLRRAGLR